MQILLSLLLVATAAEANDENLAINQDPRQDTIKSSNEVCSASKAAAADAK